MLRWCLGVWCCESPKKFVKWDCASTMKFVKWLRLNFAKSKTRERTVFYGRNATRPSCMEIVRKIRSTRTKIPKSVYTTDTFGISWRTNYLRLPFGTWNWQNRTGSSTRQVHGCNHFICRNFQWRFRIAGNASRLKLWNVVATQFRELKKINNLSA